MTSYDSVLGWPKTSKILKSISLTRFYENMDLTDEGNANRNVKWCISTLLKHRTLYKENFKKYKEKSWKSEFGHLKLLNLFKRCFMALVSISEALMDLLTPILPYLIITNGGWQMHHLCQKCQKCHIWLICHSTHVKYRYGNMDVKRCIRTSGMQTQAIKQLLNRLYSLKFRNSNFPDFPLYFLKFPLYNVRPKGKHFP